MKRIFRTGLLCMGVLAGMLVGTFVHVEEAGAAEAAASEAEDDGVYRIACIGDSITYGFGFERPEKESYPALLQALLGDEYEVFSYSGNGYALTDAGINYFNTEEYYWSLQSKADLFVIMLGSNDSYMFPWDPEKFTEALDKLILSYEEASPGCSFLFAAPPHDFAMEMFVPDALEIYEEIVEIFREEAEARDAAYLDLFAPTEGRQDLYQVDLVHPNAEGQALIAELLKEVIEEM